MKNKISSFWRIALIGGWACCVQIHALFMGNPASAQLLDSGLYLPQDLFLGLKVAYQRDQVFDRKLKSQSTLQGAVDRFAYISNQGVVSCIFMDRLEMFGSIGAAQFNMMDIPAFVSDTLSPPLQLTFQTQDALTWGAGIRATFFTWGATTLGASAACQYAHPHIRWNTSNAIPFVATGRLQYQEWQVALALSHAIDIFIPYMGVTYSRVSGRMRRVPAHVLHLADSGKFRLRSRENFGMSIGCDLSTGKIIVIGLEIQLFSEDALTLHGDIKF